MPEPDKQAVRGPFPCTDVPWEESAHGARFGMRFRELGVWGGGTHVGVCMEELQPGMQANPLHYHMLEEEHLLILEGELTLRLGDATHLMQSGSYVCFPAAQKVGHALINHSNAVCRYLLVGERNPNEVVVYPDSGRVGVRLMGEGYRKSAVMEYWEGEPG